MTDLRHELHILVSIAKVDAEINRARNALGGLPPRIDAIRRKIDETVRAENEAKEHFEEMTKERRVIEQALADNAEKIKKFKTQLMEVKTNKEYTAMLHEIHHLEKETDAKEERLLILMDELDQQGQQNEIFLADRARERAELEKERTKLEHDARALEAELERLNAEKPKFLRELDPRIKKRYDRIIAKMRDFAVTHVVDDTCQGCFSRIPPQTAVEVRKNDQIILCETCGRILVFYTT